MKLLILPLILLSTVCSAKTLKIGVVDTGLDLKDPRFQKHLCKSGHKTFTGPEISDQLAHGTHIAGLIQTFSGEGDYCFLIYKYYSTINTGAQNMKNEAAALKEAIAQGADIVNLSGGGPAFNEEEYLAVRSAPNVKFVFAAGNENQNSDLTPYYPAALPFSNIIVVGAKDADGRKSSYSNYGSRVHEWESGQDVVSTLPNGKYGSMHGTSQATAIRTGKLVRAMLDQRDRNQQTRKQNVAFKDSRRN